MNENLLKRVLDVMKRAQEFVGNTPGVGFTNAIYVPPAEAMRQAANEYEARDRLKAEYDTLVQELEVLSKQ